MKQLIKKLFGLRPEMSLSFYVLDFVFRRILRNNAKVGWAVHHTSTVTDSRNIKRGINVFPGDSPGNFINATNGLEIGDYTNIGPNVGIISINHDTINNQAYVKCGPITIGKFCWIGMNATILPGVQLGDFTTVGAGAVVNKSFPEGYSIIAGNPAQIVKKLDREACERFAATKH